MYSDCHEGEKVAVSHIFRAKIFLHFPAICDIIPPLCGKHMDERYSSGNCIR